MCVDLCLCLKGACRHPPLFPMQAGITAISEQECALTTASQGTTAT